MALAAGCVNIATHSLRCIHQIHKAVNRPQELTEHRHKELLTKIRDLIAGRPHGVPPIRLIKVPAHTGITGNKRADAIATGVSRRERYPNLAAQVPGLVGGMRRNQWWWYKETAREAQPGATEPEGTEEQAARPASRARAKRPRHRQAPGRILSNMAETLKALALERHELAGSNPNTLYMQLEREAAPAATPSRGTT